MQYRTPSFITRKGIILSRKQVPFDSALTFTPVSQNIGTGMSCFFAMITVFANRILMTTMRESVTIPFPGQIRRAFMSGWNLWEIKQETGISLRGRGHHTSL